MFRPLALLVLTIVSWTAAAFFCFDARPWHWWAVLALLVLACALTVRILITAGHGLSKIGF